MILIGIGSNLPAPGHESPLETALAAVEVLPANGIEIGQCSNWYRSEPVPASDQPWFVNAVAAISTRLSPERLLEALLAVEAQFGRERGARDAARTLDLDLLDYDGLRRQTPHLELPHPRLHQRRFVLVPLCDIAPHWRHPVLGSSAAELLSRLPPGQPVRAYREP